MKGLIWMAVQRHQRPQAPECIYDPTQTMILSQPKTLYRYGGANLQNPFGGVGYHILYAKWLELS